MLSYAHVTLVWSIDKGGEMEVGQTVNFNNGEGVVRAEIKRIVKGEPDAVVYLWAPERGSGNVKLIKGFEVDEDGNESPGSGVWSGVARRSPADYGPEGGGLTWHYIEDEVSPPEE